MSTPTAAEKKRRGQFFTRHEDVHTVMLNLLSHDEGFALEPSAGSGHLVKVLEESKPGLTIEAVELDDRFDQVCDTAIDQGDFFDWSIGKENRYAVIFGNPPYVSWKEMESATRASSAAVKSRYSDKTNLYHLFIDRCVDLADDGGEMVLIVPKEWLYTTSAAPLRAHLTKHGALTHVVDCGEEKLFSDASVPALLIFRWVKGASQGVVRFASNTSAALSDSWSERELTVTNDRWMLLPKELSPVVAGWGTLSEQFTVRVGLVTGMDKVFKLTPPISIEPECVQQQVDTSRAMVPFLNANHVTKEEDLPAGVAAILKAHEQALRSRRIATFTDSNWWKYGAIRNEDHMKSDAERFFALVKTRSPEPFFTVPGAKFFTGGVLGVFRNRIADVSVETAVKVLNSPAYRPILEAMFLTSNDKVSLQPATLMDAPFPLSESEAQEFIRNASATSSKGKSEA